MLHSFFVQLSLEIQCVFYKLSTFQFGGTPIHMHSGHMWLGNCHTAQHRPRVLILVSENLEFVLSMFMYFSLCFKNTMYLHVTETTINKRGLCS